VELNEMRMDAKIDMLHHSGLIGKKPREKWTPIAQVWGTEAVVRMVLLHEYLSLKQLFA
jgi:hypothetical protein